MVCHPPDLAIQRANRGERGNGRDVADEREAICGGDDTVLQIEGFIGRYVRGEVFELDFVGFVVVGRGADGDFAGVAVPA